MHCPGAVLPICLLWGLCSHYKDLLMPLHKVDLAVVAREVEELQLAIQEFRDAGQSHRIFAAPWRRLPPPPLRSKNLDDAPKPLSTPPPELPRIPRNEELEAAKQTTTPLF